MSSPLRYPCSHGQDCIRPECLEACLERFIPCLLEYLHRKGVEEDVASEACFNAWRKAVKWIKDGRAAKMSSAQRRGYLCRTAFYAAIDILRRKRSCVLVNAVSLSRLRRCDEPAAAIDPLNAAESKEQISLVQECLPALNADERCLLELRYHEDASFSEIAGVLGCCEATAFRRVKVARERLTDLLIRARVQNAERLSPGRRF